MQAEDEAGRESGTKRPDVPNLRHIRLLAAAIERQSLTAAAETVHISQPAASQAIAKLGRLYGCDLLQRRGNSVVPTAEGEIVNNRGRRALSRLREANRKLASRSRLSKGLVFDTLERGATVSHLRAVAAFAETGSFAASARALGQAEPSLQRAARELERLGGVPLFDGAYRSLHLTASGEMLAEHASLVLKELAMAHDELRENAGIVDGRVVIGTLPLVRTRIVPAAVVAITARHRGARIEMVDGAYDALVHQLTIGSIDMMVGALRTGSIAPVLRQQPLFTDELSVVARADHPLAREGAQTIGRLAEFPWVVARKGTPNRAIFERLLGPLERGYVETGSLVAMRGILLLSDHLTLISRRQIEHELRTGLLTEIDFPLDQTEREIGLTVRTDWQPTRLQREFVDMLAEAVASDPASS